MKGKIFTVDEARKMLPLVRQIAGDIVALERERKALATRYKELAEKDELSVEELEEMHRTAEDSSNSDSLMLTHVEELEELGCFLKSAEEGLVDWYGEIEGKIVYLCWRVGEEDILYYHDLQAGVRGRKPIPVGTPRT